MSFLSRKIIFFILVVATSSIFSVFANEEFNTFSYNAKLKLGDINVLETSKINQTISLESLIDRDKTNIVICDSEYYYKNDYICNEQELSTNLSIDYIVDENFNPEQNYILQKEIEDVTLLIIPQEYIENTDIAPKTAQHLNSYIEHTKFKYISEKESVSSRIAASIVGNPNYSMIIFSILIFLSIIFTSIIFNKKANTKGILYKIVKGVIIFLSIAVLVNASISDVGKIDFIFIREYILYTFTLKNLWSIIAAFSKTRILLLALAALWFGLLIFRFKRSLIDIAKKTPRIYAEDKTYFLVLVIIVFAMLNTTVIGLSPLRKNIILIHIVFITLIYLIFIGNKSIERIKTNVRYLAFIIVSSMALLTLKNVDKATYYENKILIGSSSKVVYLPYRKEHTQDALFEDQFFKDTINFTIDKYLVYYPGYDMVINTNRDIPSYDFFDKQSNTVTERVNPKENSEHILVNVIEGDEYTSKLKSDNDLINLSSVVNDMQTKGLLDTQFIISSYSGENIIIRYDL